MKKYFTSVVFAMMAMVAMADGFPTHVYLCGPAGPGWATQSWPMFTVMDNDTPTGEYQWVGDLQDGQLKFLYGESWEPAYVSVEDGEALTVGEHTMSTRLSGADPDNKWVATAGRYKLTINASTMTLKVEDGTGLESLNGDSQQTLPATVFPIGDATAFGWDLGQTFAFDQTSEGVYEGNLAVKNGELKFMHQQDWGAQYGPVENGENITGLGEYSLCKPGNDNKWKVTGIEEATEFHFTLDVNNGKLVVSSVDTAIKDVVVDGGVHKFIENGQIVIVRNGTRYSVMGVRK